jgi:hypothetical protein
VLLVSNFTVYILTTAQHIVVFLSAEKISSCEQQVIGKQVVLALGQQLTNVLLTT